MEHSTIFICYAACADEGWNAVEYSSLIPRPFPPPVLILNNAGPGVRTLHYTQVTNQLTIYWYLVAIATAANNNGDSVCTSFSTLNSEPFDQLAHLIV